jgi:hypothetical protein
MHEPSGGGDAGTVARALAQKGGMTAWQYNVRRGPNGELQQAPTAKIGLIANPRCASSPTRRPMPSCRMSSPAVRPWK